MDVVTDFGGGYAPGDADLAERGTAADARGDQPLAQHPGHQERRRGRPGPRLRGGPEVRHQVPEATPTRPASRSASVRSSCTTPTSSAPTARSRTAACSCPGRSSSRSRTATGRRSVPDPRQQGPQRPAGRQPAGRLHHDRHPRREHGPGPEPVLVAAQDHRRQQAPAGRPQDRHDERPDRPRGDGLPRAAARTPRLPPSSSAPGWATATTASRPTGRWPWRARRRSGRRSSTRPARARRSPTSASRPASSTSRSTPTAGCCPARTRSGRSPSTSSRAPSRPRSTTPRSRWRSTRRPGSLWADGCTGPSITKGFLDLTQVEAAFPKWQPFNLGWIERAKKGPGVRGGPKRTPTDVLRVRPHPAVRGDLGRAVRPDQGLHGPRRRARRRRPSCDPIFLGCPSPVRPACRPQGAAV